MRVVKDNLQRKWLQLGALALTSFSVYSKGLMIFDFLKFLCENLINSETKNKRKTNTAIVRQFSTENNGYSDLQWLLQIRPPKNFQKKRQIRQKLQIRYCHAA